MINIRTMYITKYALTKGIKKEKGELLCNGSMFRVTDGYAGLYFHGTDFHETSKSAIAKAEQMRTNKIASLNNQIKKLEKMRFDIN